MKNSIIILIPILTLLFIGCSDVLNRENVVSFEEFNNQISISGRSCSEIRDDIYPMFLGIKDSVLVLCDLKSDPHVYDIKKAKMFNSYKQGIIKAKPDGTRFVKAFGYIPVIDVYNNKAELILSIIQDGYRKPDINTKDKQFVPETRVYYTNVFLSDKYIYALNQNCTLQELSEGSCTDVEIHMFSWTGEPLYKILLNEGIGALAPFVVDEVNKSIYVVNPKSQNDYLRVFDIGQIE